MIKLVGNIFKELPPLFEKSNNLLLKYIILIIIEKMLTFSESFEVQKILKNVNLSNFLSQQLLSEDMMIVTITLLIIDVTIEKNPEIYVTFVREGLKND